MIDFTKQCTSQPCLLLCTLKKVPNVVLSFQKMSISLPFRVQIDKNEVNQEKPITSR